MNFARLLCLVVVAQLGLGCSTLIKYEYEDLEITTKPAGAKVTFDNGISCHTPCELELERGENYRMTIAKAGFKSQTVDIKGDSWDGWLWGNLAFVFAAPIGVAYDFYSGYAYDFAPEKVDLELSK